MQTTQTTEARERPIVRERPVLFSGEMVRAILADSKTQTRRAIKPQPAERPGLRLDAYCSEPKTPANPRGMSAEWAWWTEDHRVSAERIRCPYGAPGDRLWVRETWLHDADEYDPMLSSTQPHYRGRGTLYRADLDGDLARFGPWRPSIHMPRWASRITLEVASVRVERLHDISEEDSLAEGIRRIDHGRGDHYYHHNRTDPHPQNWACPVDAFRDIWERINGPESWRANPWVWVVGFRRVEAPR